MRPLKEKQNDYNTDNNWPRRYFRNPLDRDRNHLNDGDWGSKRSDVIREKSVSTSTPHENYAEQSHLRIRVVKEKIDAYFLYRNL